MTALEPRIYRLVLYFDASEPWSMEHLCKDLFILAELQEPIQEDEWGIRGVLEIWFQEIEESRIIIHIQKKHSSRKNKYIKDLEEFFGDLDNLDYIKSYQEIGFNV